MIDFYKIRTKIVDMNLYKRFIKWLNQPDVTETKWAEYNCRVTKVSIEFDNGLIRTLEGAEAKEYFKDVYFNSCGRHVDFKRHNWREDRSKCS